MGANIAGKETRQLNKRLENLIISASCWLVMDHSLKPSAKCLDDEKLTRFFLRQEIDISRVKLFHFDPFIWSVADLGKFSNGRSSVDTIRHVNELASVYWGMACSWAGTPAFQ